MKKSAFLPGQRSDLVHRHMQSHLIRVEQAKGRVDTTTPKSLLVCTKMKDRRAERERRATEYRDSWKSTSSYNYARDYNRHTTAGDSAINQSSQWPCGEAADPPRTDSSGPGRAVPYLHLLELCSGDEDNMAVGRWPHYHTPTGRLTGFLRERQIFKHKEHSHSKQVPWRPPYTNPVDLHVHRPKDGNGHSIWRPSAATCTCQKGGAVHMSESTDTAVAEQEADTHVPTTMSATQCATQTRESAGEDDGISFNRGRELLLEGADMRQKAHAITKRNSKAKQECQDLSLEYCYLQFVSEVTQDVLRRGVLTRPAFELLCKTHIDRHKYTLREDEMLKRVDELKTQIGLS